MKRRLTFVCLVAALCGTETWGFVSHFASNSDDPELKACFERLENISSLKQEISFLTYAGAQSTGRSGVDISWKALAKNDSRILVRVTNPPARVGVGLLILEEQQAAPSLHMYLPELRSVRRISGNTLNGSLLSSDFTYEDFLHLYGLTNASKIVRLENTMISDRDVYVSELTPKDKQSGYSKIRSFIDQQWCVPLQVDFYAKNKAIKKTLVVEPEDIQEVDGYRLPLKFSMKNLVDDTRTDVSIESIEINKPISDGKFSLSNLRSGR